MRYVILFFLLLLSSGFLVECEGLPFVDSSSGDDESTVIDTRAAYPTLQTDETGAFVTAYAPDTVYQWRLTDGGFVIGMPDAPVTLVVFADFLCPHCQRYTQEVDRFFETFVLTGQAKFEHRFLPTQARSPFVSAVVECAAEMYPGGFYPVYQKMYSIASSRAVDDNIGQEIAAAFLLDADAMQACADSADQVEIDRMIAAENLVNATPSLRVRFDAGALELINEDAVQGPVSFETLAVFMSNLGE